MRLWWWVRADVERGELEGWEGGVSARHDILD